MLYLERSITFTLSVNALRMFNLSQWVAIDQKIIQGGFYFSQSTTKFLAKTTTQKMNFLVKNFFRKCK